MKRNRGHLCKIVDNSKSPFFQTYCHCARDDVKRVRVIKCKGDPGYKGKAYWRRRRKEIENLFIVIVIMNCLSCSIICAKEDIQSFRNEKERTSIFSTLAGMDEKIAVCGSRKRFLSIIPLDILKRYRVYVRSCDFHYDTLLLFFLISSCLVPL